MWRQLYWNLTCKIEWDTLSSTTLKTMTPGEVFQFKWKERRLRCAGHVINLVARQILFGKNPDALQLEVQEAKEELKELELWRKKGPIGKLHNIVTYIRHSDQRNQLFKEVQRFSYIAIENRTSNQQ